MININDEENDEQKMLEKIEKLVIKLKEDSLELQEKYEHLMILYSKSMGKLARIVDYAVEHEDKELLMFMSKIEIRIS